MSKAVRPLPLGKEVIDEVTGENHLYGGFADVEQRADRLLALVAFVLLLLGVALVVQMARR